MSDEERNHGLAGNFHRFMRFLKSQNYTVRDVQLLPYGEKELYKEWLKFSGYAAPYDPKYGDSKLCQCGHPYYRHFDTYEDMFPVGCKYCHCRGFVLADPERECNGCKGKGRTLVTESINDPITGIVHYWTLCEPCTEARWERQSKGKIPKYRA